MRNNNSSFNTTKSEAYLPEKIDSIFAAQLEWIYLLTEVLSPHPSRMTPNKQSLN
jgi:hypothetical protein